MFELVGSPDEFVFGGRQAGRTLKMGVGIGAKLQRAKSLWEVVDCIREMADYLPHMAESRGVIHAIGDSFEKNLKAQGIERPK